MSKPTIQLSGSEDFRQRLVLATLSGSNVRISKIRSDDIVPGLRDYEVSFLRLLESITNGSVIEISYTGTTVVYKPGLIIGGNHVHKCPLSKGIGYFIEPLLLLGSFGKSPLTVTFHGVTGTKSDIGVDLIRTALFPILQQFGIENHELRIVKRGSMPDGGGEVVLRMPHLVLQPKTIHATVELQITKIRGIAYSTRVSPSFVNRMIDSAREVLKSTQVETFIYSDAARGEEAGKSPGFGITLVAETKNQWCIATEGVGLSGETPESLGEEVALKLLEEISSGGVVGKKQIELAIVLMSLGKEDVGRIVVGKNTITAKVVRLLRYIKLFWKLDIMLQEEENIVQFIVKGSGFVSSSKKIA